MSRNIDFSRPLTEEEKDYLRTRAFGEEKIALNARQFDHLSEEEQVFRRKRAEKDAEFESPDDDDDSEDGDEYDPEDIAQVEGLTIGQIRERLAKEGLSDEVTDQDRAQDPEIEDKGILAFRLLDHLDALRKS